MTTVNAIRASKGKTRLAVLTAFDAPTAAWCQAGGVDIVLVGDSFGMVSLGLPDTTGVTMQMMMTAVAAVRRGFGEGPHPMVVADMPLEGFRNGIEAGRRLIEAGADAVKVECHAGGMNLIEALVRNKVEVMAHVGLLPQIVKEIGGYKLQGKTEEEAARILADAERAQDAGAFSCVIEKVPASLGRRITATLRIPTIGIGAGRDCDGQVLVLYDILGVYDRFRPKFARRYADLGRDAVRAITSYTNDVRARTFPNDEESFE